MTHPLIVTSDIHVGLKPAPIDPSWIHEGNPTATNSVLAVSPDGTAAAIIWQCTEGKFEWHYDSEETIHFLEGQVVISADGMPPRRFGPGDIVYFKKGAVANWHIEKRIRKLAFFRRPLPSVVGKVINLAKKVRNALRGGNKMPTGTMIGQPQ